jgi:NAD(P)-dependent dehydrogenase (short-subunit alcohol dehydrogenase family)
MMPSTPSLRTGIYNEIDPRNFEGTLEGKVALVTGSGGGIGREIALSLAKSGAAVAITGGSKGEVEQSTKDVLALGDKVKAVGIVADGCNRSDLKKLVQEVLKCASSPAVSRLTSRCVGNRKARRDRYLGV